MIEPRKAPAYPYLTIARDTYGATPLPIHYGHVLNYVDVIEQSSAPHLYRYQAESVAYIRDIPGLSTEIARAVEREHKSRYAWLNAGGKQDVSA